MKGDMKMKASVKVSSPLLRNFSPVLKCVKASPRARAKASALTHSAREAFFKIKWARRKVWNLWAQRKEFKNGISFKPFEPKIFL